MPLYSPSGGLLSTSDWDDLATKLVNGDGYGWHGDPRLSLQIGILKNRKTGKSGQRLEVWRHNEDGTDTMIGHWLPTESIRVCYDLARMSLNSRGHVSSVDSIEAHNQRIEKEKSEQFRETAEEMMRHALHAQDRHDNPGNPRVHTFDKPEVAKPSEPETV